MKKLLTMLSYRRPAGSKGEEAFINRYIRPMKPKEVEKNLILAVPGDFTTLFSCHTDTVHRDDKIQKVLFDENMACAYKDDGEPLGGDDTVGVWLLLEMIKAKIPGIYVFHYGEERGCIGSHAMAKKHPDWLAQFSRAIAFDRRGTTSIITHQRSERCCSDTFGLALMGQLKNGYELDNTGLYTDTASYMEIIPECTNISVGYASEHGPNETVDVAHALLLAELVRTVKWAELPAVRDPKVRESKYQSYEYGGYGFVHKKGKHSSHIGAKREEKKDFDQLTTIAQDDVRDFESALEMVKGEPELAAQILLCYTDYFFGDRFETTDQPTLEHIIPAGTPPPALPATVQEHTRFDDCTGDEVYV